MPREPFNLGQRVKIIRARHGWHDGRTEGTVDSKFIVKGRSTFSYIVKGDDGTLYEINRTNDIRAAC